MQLDHDDGDTDSNSNSNMSNSTRRPPPQQQQQNHHQQGNNNNGGNNPPGTNTMFVLNDVEKIELLRIWYSNRREVLDVQSTQEELHVLAASSSCGSGSSAAGSNSAASKALPAVMSSNTYNFIGRIYKFISTILEREILMNNDNSANNNNNNKYQYIKENINDSCFRDLVKMVVIPIETDENKNNNSNNNNQNRQSCRTVVLPKGRRVLVLSYHNFISELNHYESFGRSQSNLDNNSSDSFACYLYFFPTEALTVLSCAVRFAILRLYKKQIQQQMMQQQQQPSSSQMQVRNNTNNNDIVQFLDTTQFVIRFVRVEPKIPLMDIKTGLVGRFVSVVGYVVKTKTKRLRVATSDFKCTKCSTVITHAFYNNNSNNNANDNNNSAGSNDTDCYSPMPMKCTGVAAAATGNGATTNKDNKKCLSRSFTLLRETARYVSVQELRLQEAPEESSVYAGRTPRQITVTLTNDLVDTTRPGDTVKVAGIVAAEAVEKSSSSGAGAAAGNKRGRYGGNKNKANSSTTYQLYLQCHSITTMSESSSSNNNNKEQRKDNNNTSSQAAVVFSNQQIQKITQLCHADHRCFTDIERRAFPFDLLVRSLCPAIIGHYAVKAGLLLCLLGGTTTSTTSQLSSSSDAIRSNSHILIVGDPGMGKSQMLLAASQLAARSVYVGGNTSSTTGLTVTLTKEERGESAIEAGALVLADQGVCCIDEFDKMAKTDGLLEAMEQQQVSIAKAGVVASLPSRCSVIAAANPRHGSYNMDKTVAENLNMAKPILSRFDLVFILRDRADKTLDQRVSSNIVNLYRNRANPPTQMSTTTMEAAAAAAAAGFGPTTQSGPRPAGEDKKEKPRMPLADRLAWVNDFQKQPLPASLVRDYIAYAREYCKPKLTPAAADVLQKYYMRLRYPSDGQRKHDTVPITTRQLEALIRLCQARAKCCLREYVLEEDALDVVELMSISVEQVHSDEGGALDRGRGGAAGQSKRKMKRAFTEELRKVVGIGRECSKDDLRRIANNVNYPLHDFSGLVEELHENGVVMKKSSGRYQVL